MYPICNLRYFQVARVFEFYSLLFLKDCSTLNIPNCSLKMVSRYEGRMCFCLLLLSFPFSGLQSSALILFELSALLAFRAAVSTFSPDVDGAMRCFLTASVSLRLLLVLPTIWLSDCDPMQPAALGARTEVASSAQRPCFVFSCCGYAFSTTDPRTENLGN